MGSQLYIPDSKQEVFKELGYLDVEMMATLLGYSIGKDGRCRQLEKFADTTYCQKRGIRKLPTIWKKTKRMLVARTDFDQWLLQFKDE